MGYKERLLALCLGALSGPAQALEPGEMDAGAIVRSMTEQNHGDRQTSVLEVTVTHPSGRKLERVVRRSSMDFEHGTRTLLRFEAPAQLRDTVLLSVDVRGASEPDERWLYLPGLKTVSRIFGAQESVPFLGTDLTFADIMAEDLDAYDYKVVAVTEDVDDEACWVLERRPRSGTEAKRTGYVKSRLWVSKQKLLAVQAKHWVEDGRRLKYLKYSQFEQIDQIWVAQRMLVRVVKAGKVESTTLITTRDVHFNQAELTADLFSVEQLGTSRKVATDPE